MNLLLSYADQPGSSRDHSLDPAKTYTLGRGKSSDILLNHPKVSTNHLRFRYSQSKRWLVEDLGSTNGTYVDGNKISQPHEITDACSIRLGPSGPILRVSPQGNPSNASGSYSSKKLSAESSRVKPNNQPDSETNSGSKTSKLPGLLSGLCIAGLVVLAAQIPRDLTKSNSNQDTATDTKADTQSTNTDAAVEVSQYIHYFPDPIQPSLDDEAQYRRAIGDMARIQAEKLYMKARARDFPTIVIGRQGFSKCDTPVSPGIYNPACREILVAFNSGELQYEQPIEVLYVLAHEYAHHLVEISLGTSISGLDNELTADCFAGYMAGYWASVNKLNEQELMAGFSVMQAVAKQEPTDSTDMHGDPGQRQGAFLGGYSMASGKVTQEYQNFCRTLDRILKL